MPLRLTQGDLFASGAEALVNPVNVVGVMGAGLALKFRRAYPSMFEEYRDACLDGRVQLGKVHTYTCPTQSPRYIVNLPTKSSWRDPSRIGWVQEGLRSLRAEVDRLAISSIAIPALGCGNGGLPWSRVRPLILDTFSDAEDVQVLVFEPLT